MTFNDRDSLLWYDGTAAQLLEATPFHTGTVHAMDTSDDPRYATREILNARINLAVPSSRDLWADMTKPNLPWAEDHFAERVGGEPVNPPKSAESWPFAQEGHKEHTNSSGLFSHTYPERFWPKLAGVKMFNNYRSQIARDAAAHWGIRFQYGDLSDMVYTLAKNPHTRQAYLPVWFPEDTWAASHGARVPCTIGYHFMIRGDYLHCWYTMRSCDYIRYLRDDVYMAGRLMQWIVAELETNGAIGRLVYPGELYLTISSLHSFVGDDWALKRLKRRFTRVTSV